MLNYFDIHAHLTHDQFVGDVDEVVSNARRAGLKAIIVNGLDPASNRQTLELANKYDIVYPALGIYPVDAANAVITQDLPVRVSKFSVDKEIEFIRERAASGDIVAIGECGLDGHWIGEDTYAEQERVFTALLEVAMDHDLPIIIHTRGLEKRAGEILAHHGAKYVDFHCFGGRTKLAQTYAEQNGWWFSIPSSCNRNGAFQKMLRNLPVDKILLETDCPYLGPEKGKRNEPATVVGSVSEFSSQRSISLEEAGRQLWSNFQTLFRCGKKRGFFD